MRKFAFTFLAIAFALSITGNFPAQTKNVPATSPHLPRGTATDINNSEIEALVRKMATERVGDQAIRIVSINREYNLAMGVVSRLKTTPKEVPAPIEHSQITEIYHVISGSGTLVTGGMLKDPKEIPPNDEVVTIFNGPSTEGSSIQNGVSRKIGPGDVVIIPPNTPHWFSEIPTDKIVYLVVRVDPHRVLPVGYVPK
jgi:mannose-6-phosphate isomerase-like protein (cupin superfamily)